MYFKVVLLVLVLTCLCTDDQYWSSVCTQAQTTKPSDTIKPGEVLRYSDKMLVSADGTFELGFFNVSYSSKRFLGIRYASDVHLVRPWVWVANRETPVYDANATLAMDVNGLLEIIPGGKEGGEPIVLNPNRTSPESTAVLESSGNLVVKELNPDGTLRRVLWESFNHPADTLFPEMRLGERRVLTSWLSKSNPSPGAFSLEYDHGSGEPLVVRRRGNVFSRHGTEMVEFLSDSEASFFDNGTEIFFKNKRASFAILRLNPDGRVTYSNFSSSATLITGCSGGVSFASGCAEGGPAAAECRTGNDDDGFVGRGVRLLSNGSWSSTLYTDEDPSAVLTDCLDRCWKNCSCIGFNTLYSDGTGCTFWSEGAQFVEGDFFLDNFFLLNSSFHKSESGNNGSGLKWWIWVMVFSLAFWL